MRQACDDVGRDPATVEVSCMWIPAAEGIDSVKRYEDLGVSRLIVPAMALGGVDAAAVERFANEFQALL